jgi:radical SAM superfamily enzyme YgiQ (UPF0313 family)
MQVLLVNPSTPKLWVPIMLPQLGILHIASALREWEGIEPILWDTNYTDEPPMTKADVLMVTANSSTFAEACRVAERIEAPLKIVGGPHSTALPSSSVKGPFNVACIGEGERTACEIIRTYMIEGTIEDLKGIPGTSVRNNGSAVIGAPRDFLPIDSIPWPAYDLWPDLGEEQ